MFKKGSYLKQIANYLTALILNIQIKNKDLFLNDDNILSEDFYKDLINKIYGYKLVNLNIDSSTFPGTDLGDLNNKVCVQVTSDNSAEKIQKTLDSLNKYNRGSTYERFVILIIGHKKSYTKNFNIGSLDFDKDNDIWDIHTIIKKVRSLGVESLEDIVNYLDMQLEMKVSIAPIDLLENDICEVIDLLFIYIEGQAGSDLHSYQKRNKILKREGDYISEKNKLNGVSDIFFSDIKDNLKYNTTLMEFLRDPINKDFLRKYYVIVNYFHELRKDNNECLEDLFSFIFDNVWSYKSDISSEKLIIILHNMYFNCDLGYNTK